MNVTARPGSVAACTEPPSWHHPIAGRRRHRAVEQRLHTKLPPAHAPARSKNPSQHSVHKPPSHTTAGRKQHRVDRALRATQSRQRKMQTATNHPRLKIIVGREESKHDRERTSRPGANKQMLRSGVGGRPQNSSLKSRRCFQDLIIISTRE